MMRRMRGFAWYHLLFAIPAVAAAFGVQYFMRKNYPESPNPELASVMKPSAFKADSGNDPASEQNYRNPAHTKGRKAKGAKARATDDDVTSDDRADRLAGRDGVGEDETGVHTGRHGTNHAEMALPSFSSDGVCSSVEYRGDGPIGTSVSPREWATVVDQFLTVKKDLSTWLNHHKKEIPDRTVALMEKQLAALKIQRPPALEEPDLSWRGIGVWTMDTNGNSLIRIGGGFIRLVTKQPTRAKFELTRLVAQAWAPCELARGSSGESWDPLLKCMEVNETQACGTGSYSEGGWAVSTALATIVSPPGCTVPAFKKGEIAQCLKKVPLPLTIAQNNGTRAIAGSAPSETSASGGETPAASVHEAPAGSAHNHEVHQ